MDRIVFNNPFDKNSRDYADSLGDGVTVIDAFARDALFPRGVVITTLPYLIDKQFVLVSEGPYTTAGFTLQFQCRDYQDNPLDENRLFIIEIDGQRYYEMAIDGVISIEIDCPYAKTFDMAIHDDHRSGYLPWFGSIEVVNASAG